jgi:hypothetical protein
MIPHVVVDFCGCMQDVSGMMCRRDMVDSVLVRCKILVLSANTRDAGSALLVESFARDHSLASLHIVRGEEVILGGQRTVVSRVIVAYRVDLQSCWFIL